MRYYQIEYCCPDEMCEIEIHNSNGVSKIEFTRVCERNAELRDRRDHNPLNYLSPESIDIARSEEEDDGTIWILFIIFSDQFRGILESLTISDIRLAR